MSDELVKRLRSQEAVDGRPHEIEQLTDEAAAMIEQQAARIAELEALLVKANDAWLAMSKTTPAAPAVDAQPVAVVLEDEGVKLMAFLENSSTRLNEGDLLYASAQSEGLRKDAEELLRRIPTTPEQMVDFIGSHFDSMQADGWTDTLPSKPTGDLSMVRYSLTVHDLLSAFDWADLSADALDAALSQHKAGDQS